MSFLKRFDLSPKQIRFLKFGSLGGITTVFGIVLYFLFLKILGIKLIIAYPIVFTLSVLFSYILNTYFNYKIPPTWANLLNYYKGYILSALIGYVLLVILKTLLPEWDEFIIAMILVFIRLLMTFFFIEKFIFGKVKNRD